MKRNLFAAWLACVVLLPFLSQSARAFPDRPVKIIVPSPPGGPPDIVARLLTQQMGSALGQPVFVENRAGGAGGMIGAKSAMAEAPDGYSLLMGSTSTLLIAPLIYKNPGYDAQTFAPVAGLSESAEVLTVRPGLAARSVADLVGLAKAQPGKLRYGSAGVGSLPHLEGELLKSRARIDMIHIPYRGGGPALVGLLDGEVQIFFSTVTQMLPYIRDGKLRGLAVTSASRSPLAPEIPTMQESGFDKFVTASINFLVAPPRTPLAIRQRLAEAVDRALASAQVEQAFAKIGAKEQPASPDQLKSYLAQQQVRWSSIVATTQISVE